MSIFQRVQKPILSVALGALVAGWASLLTVSTAGAAPSLKSNQHYAAAQLVKLTDLPSGWSKNGSSWVGTTQDQNSSSEVDMTQYPDLSNCMGISPPLSVVAAEADSPMFNSNDQNTNVADVADVYANASQAKSDFPPVANAKFASCFVKVQSSNILGLEQATWPTGSTFGTLTASTIQMPKIGDQSVMIEVQVPVTIPDQGSTSDFYTVLVVRQGRSTAELFIDQANVPPSATLTTRLAKLVTARMKAPPPPSSKAVLAA